MKLYKKDKKELTSALVNYLINSDDYIETDVLVSKINSSIPLEDRYKTSGLEKEVGTKIMVTTGCGNTIQGGADIWTNYFIEEVWKRLKSRKRWKLIIDSKKPADFEL